MRAGLIGDLIAEGYTKFEADAIASWLLVEREVRRFAGQQATHDPIGEFVGEVFGLVSDVRNAIRARRALKCQPHAPVQL
jgi:hypothetical protein